MALWTNREKNSDRHVPDTIQPEKSDIRKLEELRKQLKEKAESKMDELSKLSGIIVSLEGQGFSKNDKFIFNVDDENYIFTKYYERTDCILPSVHLSPEDEIESYKQIILKYKEILEIQPFYLKKDEFSSNEVPLNTQMQKSETYIGETEHSVGNIKFSLISNANSNNGIVITITDLKQDLSVLDSLKQTLHFKNFYNILDIPEDSFQVTIINGNNFCREDTYHAFREHNQLILVCVRVDNYYGKDKIIIIQIEVDNILYYKSEGSVRYEQQISGGGGMGINYGSAILGGLLFGEAGAIIGSRRNEEISEIESKTIKYDDRIVTLVVKKDGQIFQIGFHVNNELAFDWLIPERQYDYVIQKRREKYEQGTI